MAFTDRGAPRDTAIEQEALTENIDIRGPGRYYPEEYSGPIQAINNRGQVIADVPKTLAGIVLNYDEHALNTWQSKQQVMLHNKDLVNRFLIQNRTQQMELSTDLEIYDARKELESQIFEVRKNIANLGGRSEEQAVSEVLENFKDKFSGRLVPDRKWQSVLQEFGNRKLAEARMSDLQTDNTLAQFAIQNEYNEIYHSVIGVQQNPDGTFQPMMSIQEGMDEFIKRISSLIPHTNELKRIEILQNYFNGMVQGQGQALVELYRKGQISADTLMAQLAGLREVYGKTHTWFFTDDNGNKLKDANNKDMSVDLSLGEDTETFLIKAYNDAKNGIGNGGEKIAEDVVADFDKVIGWNDIQNQGWSNEILAMTPEELTNTFMSQVVNVIGSTASDSTKIKNVDKLFQKYNTCYMLTGTRQLLNKFGPDALNGLRTTIREINNKLNTQKDDISWQDFNGTITVNGKEYSLGLSPMDSEFKRNLAKLGVDMSLLAPKLGDTSMEAAMYWKDTVGLLQKYADYIETNNMGEVANVVNNEVKTSYDDAVSMLTPSQMFTYADDHKTVIGFNEKTSENFRNNIDNAAKILQRQNSRKHIPISVFENINTQLNKIPNLVNNFKAKEFIVENLMQTPAASDIYVYSRDCLENQKEDNGLLSMSALLNNPRAYQNCLQNIENYGNISFTEEQKKDIHNRAISVKNKLAMPEQDYRLYEPLEEWCAIAAYDPNRKEINTTLYEDYLRDSLKDQYVDLNNSFFKNIGGNAFDKTKVYRNHPALIPYANNLDRLRDIGTSFKQELKSSTVPSYLKDRFDGAVLTPDFETGMWYITKNGTPYTALGKKVGVVFDNPAMFKTMKPQDVTKLAMENIVSAFSIGHYDDYKKDTIEKQKNSFIAKGAAIKRGGITYDSAKQYPLMTEDEFNRKHAARVNILKDQQKLQKILTRFNSRYDLDGGTASVIYGYEGN